MTLSVVGLNGTEQATPATTTTVSALSHFIRSSRVRGLPLRHSYPQSKTACPKKARRAPKVIIALQDVLPEILVLDDPEQPFPHCRTVEHDVLGGIVGQLEQHVLEQGRQ